MYKKDAVKKTLKVSFADGFFASVMTGLSETFFTPYCLALGGTTKIVGLLSSIPNLASSLFQLKSSDAIIKAGSRKKILTACVLLHAFMWLPIIAIPFIFKANPAVYLIIFVAMYAVLNSFPGPAWASMMSDYIPAQSRGKYFGWRNRMLGMVVVLAAFCGGFILKFFSKKPELGFNYNPSLFGFTVIFSIAFLARLISWYFLTKMYEPKLKISKESYFSFWDFVKRAKESNFAKFVFFVGAMSFAVNLAGPFFAVYMLRDLKLDYLSYTVVVTSATLTTLVMMGIWGRHADVVGNIKVLKTTALFLPIIPVLWLFSGNLYYLIIIQIWSGVFWSGFNLSASNFIYDAVTPQKRSRCVAYFNAVNGIAIYLGAGLGGFLAVILPPIRGNSILCLFALSAFVRVIVVAIFYKKIKEVRPSVKKVSSFGLFSSLLRINSIFDK